jgi:pimeloyl-ACP methyl ester carboxylesterase
MKKYLFITLWAVLLVNCTVSGQSVKYGSNNGKFLSISKTRIYYEEYGKGMPLLLLHGGLGSISNFEKCIPELSKKYRVIAADSPSHGRSDQIDSLTYSLMADYFSKMIDELKLDTLYVMGWSDGGVIALTLAASRPDKVKKVIATGVNYRADGMTQDAINFTNSMSVEAVEAVRDTDAFVKEWYETYRRLSGSEDSWKKYIVDVKKLWLTEIYIPQEKLKNISMPVMLVVGDRDVIKLEHSIEIRNMIRHSQFCVLPNTSHDVYREKPVLITAIAGDFFK